jgi:hypothetical protein
MGAARFVISGAPFTEGVPLALGMTSTALVVCVQNWCACGVRGLERERIRAISGRVAKRNTSRSPLGRHLAVRRCKLASDAATCCGVLLPSQSGFDRFPRLAEAPRTQFGVNGRH